MSRPLSTILGGVGLGLFLACGGLLLGFAARWDWSWQAQLGAFFGLLFCGLGLGILLNVIAEGMAWWASEHTRLWLDGIRGEAQQLANQVTAAKLALEQAIVKTDDDPGLDEGLQRGTTAARVLRFFHAGNALGFALDGLAAAEVVSQSTWQRLKDFYLIYPDKSPVLVDRGGNVGTVWAPTWTIWRVGDEIAQGTLPLPPGAPPDVGVYAPSQHNANARKNTRKAAAGAVVEGQVVGK